MKKLTVLLAMLCALLLIAGCQPQEAPATEPTEPAEHVHTLVHMDAKAPTCVNNGIKEHWYCPECNARFSDEAATAEVTFADLEIEENGHTPAEDDGDCTTAVDCTVCGKVATPAKPHTPAADDGNCLTAVECTECDKNAVEAKDAHEAAEDDGDCTTAVKCVNCDVVITEAKEAHTGGIATCLSGKLCDTCGKEYSEENPDNHDLSTMNVNGKCGCGTQFIASDGINVYTTFDSAIHNWADGTTLKLYTDVTAEQGVSIDGKAVTLDLNGHTYSYKSCVFTVKKGASLTVMDTSAEADGLLTNTGTGSYTIHNNGTLTLVSGTIKNSAQYDPSIYVSSGGILNITGGTVENTVGEAINIQSSGIAATVSGGRINGGSYGIMTWADLTVAGAPSISSVLWCGGVTNLSGMTAEGLIIKASEPLTVGTDLILPTGAELQINTIPASQLQTNQTGVVSHPHEGGTATCGAQAICDICSKPYGTTPAHDFDEYGQCVVCGQISPMYVTDGDYTFYAVDAASLKTAVENILNYETTFTVNLPADADATLFNAIRRAIVDCEWLSDGSIHLTLAGVTAIPDHLEWNYDSLIFGTYMGDVQEEVNELASINLPDVISIGDDAFRCCKYLTSITAPKLQIIGESAFSYTALTTLELPEVTTIGSFAFSACIKLTTVKLPKATYIDDVAFYVVFDLTTVELTTADDIAVVEEFIDFDYIGNVDLLLHANKQSQVTQNENGTATWTVKDADGNDVSYTFKSITFVGEATE